LGDGVRVMLPSCPLSASCIARDAGASLFCGSYTRPVRVARVPVMLGCHTPASLRSRSRHASISYVLLP